METKSIFASRTFYVNAATLCVGILGYLVGQEMIQDNAAVLAGLVAAQGLVNIVLRLVTTKPIAG